MAGKLSGKHNLWRLRLRIDGQPWRVVYAIDDDQETVLITRVMRRDEGTCRGLRNGQGD